MSIYFLQQVPQQGGKIVLFGIIIISLVILFFKSTDVNFISLSKKHLNEFFKNFTNYSRKKQLGIIFLLLITIGYSLKIFSGGISGQYSQFSYGNTISTLSTYDFGSFGKVKYMNSSKISNSKDFYSSEGSYKIEGDNVIMNFGGRNVILNISSDKKSLHDIQGNVYIKK
jgi:hypothetical protein